MDSLEFEELSGRVDGVAQALLRLAAQLEMEGVIHGPHVCEAWRQARPQALATDLPLQASRKVLLQLADQLDTARANRAERQ
ncbi:hypothetical protein [Comamonas aquatica]|uniref:hypothetical protein n=1 Tax=Comamonas aquatica TaxID=225991 RepID=UPI0034D6318A